MSLKHRVHWKYKKKGNLIYMNIELERKIILDLSELVVEFNEDLKKAYFNNILNKTNNIINETIVDHPEFLNIVTVNPSYGKNIELTSITGKILFPAMLYKNPFRLQIIRELKSKLSNLESLDEISLFLIKKIIKTIDIKKGGFKKSTLETLRFYLLNFNKIIDNDVNKFLPYINSYDQKYTSLTSPILLRSFPLTQKFSSYYILPKFHNFGLNAIMLRNDEFYSSISENLKCSPFGFLFNNQKEKIFSLFFSPYNRNLKSNFIEQICFFENLDLFHLTPKHKTFYNKTSNILDIYYKYIENEFTDTSISFDYEFFNKKFFSAQIDNLELFVHLLNTRKFPDDHHVHPISKHLLSYRNKIVNFYGTTAYFIYIYESNGKIITTQTDLIIKLLKNTFSNGFIIKSKSAFLVSTYLFKEDFEKQKQSFIEFFNFFKLEVKIFEDLNYTSFSFYYIPNSTYYNTEENTWKFPVYQDKSIEELMNYQAKNLQVERNRLLDPVFKQRVEDFFDTWSQEVEALNKNLKENESSNL